MRKVRYHLLDSIRGIVLISMIMYHLSWNLVYMYGVHWPWYHSKWAYIWQQSICWTFILMSGFCWSMGKNPLKRGLMVFGGGALVTIVTLVVMPQNRVVFGVLTMIGSAMLLMIPFDKMFKKLPPEVGAAVSALLFFLTRNINSGRFGFEGIRLGLLPREWYANLLTAYVGMPPADFYSTDYFSLIPWFFLFAVGYFGYGICKKRNLFQYDFWKKEIWCVGFLGKHSLLIYLLHQPVLYGVLEMIYFIVR